MKLEDLKPGMKVKVLRNDCKARKPDSMDYLKPGDIITIAPDDDPDQAKLSLSGAGVYYVRDPKHAPNVIYIKDIEPVKEDPTPQFAPGDTVELVDARHFHSGFNRGIRFKVLKVSEIQKDVILVKPRGIILAPLPPLWGKASRFKKVKPTPTPTWVYTAAATAVTVTAGITSKILIASIL